MNRTETGASTFRLAYAPGVTPSKWARLWTQRLPEVPLELVQTPSADAARLLRDGEVDAALIRLPVDTDVLSAIPLYSEVSVVVVPVDHPVAAFESVMVADLADEVVLHLLDDVLDWSANPGEGWVLPGERSALARPATVADAVALVASEVGLVVVPQSLARLHHRKDLTYRPVDDAPRSQVGLCWVSDRTTDEVEELIGIVRGRTVNSSRGRVPPTPDAPPAPVPARGDRAAATSARSRGEAVDRRAAQQRKSRSTARGQSRGQAQAKGRGRRPR
ncbi:MAG: LysR substrate-binding domain-containing protein [Cellulomonas sp.]